ncbi:unnamed protein product [Cunninghamella blakesleeana]
MSQCSLPPYSTTKFDLNKSKVTLIEDPENHPHRPQSWPIYTITEKIEKEEMNLQEEEKQKIKSYHYSYCHPKTTTITTNHSSHTNSHVCVSMLFQDSWTLSSLSEDDEEAYLNYTFEDIHFNDEEGVEDDDDDDIHEKDLSAYIFPLPPDNNHELIDSKMCFPHSIYNDHHHHPKESIIKLPFTNRTQSSISILPSIHKKPIPTFHTQSILFLFGFLFCPCWWLGWYLGSKKYKFNNQIHPPPSTSSSSSPSNHHLYDESYFHLWSSTSYYHEIQCYSKFNRMLSIVSFFLIFIIIALFVWYYIGIGKKWW